MNYDDVQSFCTSLVPERPEALKAAELWAESQNFPIIGPACGQACAMVARMVGARRIFELGSGFGYSTAWFAQAVRDNGGGEVHHTVWDEALSRQARQLLAQLDLADLVQFHVSEALAALAAAEGTFDLIFCDIDKEAYPEAVAASKPRLKAGGILLVDNLFWDAKVWDHRYSDPATQGVRDMVEMLHSDPGWSLSVFPLRDGLLLARRV